MTQLDPHDGQYYTGFYQYSVRSIKHDTLLINPYPANVENMVSS